MSALPDRRVLGRVRRALLGWYATEHRDFPWRRTTDPYAVLVSEVMLQQTQASRVVDRFERFMRRFPTAASLAAAPSADVLAEWNGLGYNRRALALQRSATAVATGGWPTSVEGLAALPGVGPYTARAVASLAFGQPAGVVDTNVRRWLLRRFAATDHPRDLQALADRLAAPGTGSEVAAWTHATMEFGAAICRARNPRCDGCPIARGCLARGRGASVPVPRQALLKGTDRAYRGAVLRILAGAKRHVRDERAVLTDLARDTGRIGPVLDEAGWQRVVSALERDGLVHRSGRMLALGAARIGA